MTHTPEHTTSKRDGQTVLIVGGGFGGVRCALDLAARKTRGMRIVLLSNRPDLEYYGAIYRLISGHSPNEVTVPLSLLLAKKGVEVVVDAVENADLNAKTVTGASGTSYDYDTLVLAVGSEVAYFGIPGMKEHALTFKSVHDALELKRHLHALIASLPALPPEEKTAAAHFVVVGGGATGIEVASELITQGRILATRSGVDPSLIAVDLIEAMPRVMPMLQETMSQKVLERLRELGVNVFLNRGVRKAEEGAVHLDDMTLHAKTIVWTAGVKANALLEAFKGLELDKKGRVVVDDHLRAKGFDNVYAIGDCAATQYSGMAQTAIHDGDYTARMIARAARGKTYSAYVPEKPAIALPVGDGWAAVYYMGMRFYGTFGWLLRQAADIRAFLTIMSPFTLLKVYRRRKRVY